MDYADLFNLSFEEQPEESDGSDVDSDETGQPRFSSLKKVTSFLDKEFAASGFTRKDQDDIEKEMQHPCICCKGTGESIDEKDRCPQCKGEKVVLAKKVLEVIVEKGMQNGRKITLPREAGEASVDCCLFIINGFIFSIRQDDVSGIYSRLVMRL
ncbi:hypothetical protein RHGRI_012370 [Rhododendron griersonianum]|uniref:DnaJ-like protein n=1 Tax=Rhododendron griersonianum TaxID=479676 RepID=A0AAV6KQ66_9ERIC|nr:hypothetical protein RHGRI_012370 [Rhododendron griersonianum]